MMMMTFDPYNFITSIIEARLVGSATYLVNEVNVQMIKVRNYWRLLYEKTIYCV